jgi:hypothetical protein
MFVKEGFWHRTGFIKVEPKLDALFCEAFGEGVETLEAFFVFVSPGGFEGKGC